MENTARTEINVKGNNNIISVATNNVAPNVKGIKELSTFEDWLMDGFEFYKKDPSYLCPSFSANFPVGRVMYSSELFGSKFSRKFSITPASATKLNVVFEFENIFRCIIGNGNYQRVACEPFNNEQVTYLSHYLKENNQKVKQPLIYNNSGIKPKTKLFFKINSSPIDNSEMLDVEVELQFLPNSDSSGEYKTTFFKYNIPTKQPSTPIKSRLGLGLIDPRREANNDVCAIFEDLN
ncbi:MAG: hypothetical protein WCV69_04360 [Patescibacteria group bacterium]|jgi:hypothetical protein